MSIITVKKTYYESNKQAGNDSNSQNQVLGNFQLLQLLK